VGDLVAKPGNTPVDKTLTAAMLTERIRQTLRSVAVTGPPQNNAVVCWSIVCLETLRELLNELHIELVRNGNNRSE